MDKHPKFDYSDISFKDNGKLKLIIVVGTRPEIIRLAAVIGVEFFGAYPEATRNILALLAFAAGFLVRTYGRELSSVVSHTIRRWDGEQASRRIELYVGRDLQFIRINGTVVGALAGLAIHAIGVLIA